MDSLGGYFREEREAQGLTFEQLAVSTRVQESYLEALEEERFNLLPEKVFTKGFVRAYARALGLDEEEALRRFSTSSGSYYQKEAEERQQVVQQEEDDRKGKADRNAVFILTIVILVGLIFIVSREQPSVPTSQTSSTQKSIPSTPSASIVEPKKSAKGRAVPSKKINTRKVSKSRPSAKSRAKAKAIKKSVAAKRVSAKKKVAAVSEVEATLSRPVQPAEKPEPIIQGVAVPPSVETVRSKRAPFETDSGEQNGPIMLELEALEITWVVVRSDDRPPHEALLQPGERALWRAHERFLLTLGNAGGVKVTLNGKSHGPLGDHGTVIRDLEIKP